MQRRLRVCWELPPRHSRGAASSTSTLAPASRAINAAHNAALPPPTTRTSTIGRQAYRRTVSMPTGSAGRMALLVRLHRADGTAHGREQQQAGNGAAHRHADGCDVDARATGLGDEHHRRQELAAKK